MFSALKNQKNQLLTTIQVPVAQSQAILPPVPVSSGCHHGSVSLVNNNWTVILLSVGTLLSISQITEAFRKIGIGDKDTAILVAVVGEEEKAEQSFQTMKTLLKGRQVSLDELPSLADVPAIQKVSELCDCRLGLYGASSPVC